MIDIEKPLYYTRTGRQAKITEAVPVRRYHIEFSNGTTAWMTEEQLQDQFTNARPAYRFATSFANGCVLVEGSERSVKFKLRRKFGDFPGQDLNVEDVDALCRQLEQWLHDRRVAAQAHSADAYDPRANGAR